MSSAASQYRSGQDTFWDQQPEISATNTIANTRPTRKKAAVVVDDWDADDDNGDGDDVDANEEEKEKMNSDFPDELVHGVDIGGGSVAALAENEAIWQAANTKAPAPKFDVVASTSLRPGAVVPPPELFQTPIRILKRPNTKRENASQGPKVLSKEEQEKQLRDKEAEYLKARERIFAVGSSSTSVDSPKSDAQNSCVASTAKAQQLEQGSNEASQGVTVIRHPIGPSPGNDDTGDNPSRGFGGRRGRRRGKKETRTNS